MTQAYLKTQNTQKNQSKKIDLFWKKGSMLDWVVFFWWDKVEMRKLKTNFKHTIKLTTFESWNIWIIFFPSSCYRTKKVKYLLSPIWTEKQSNMKAAGGEKTKTDWLNSLYYLIKKIMSQSDLIWIWIVAKVFQVFKSKSQKGENCMWTIKKQNGSFYTVWANQ